MQFADFVEKERTAAGCVNEALLVPFSPVISTGKAALFSFGLIRKTH